MQFRRLQQKDIEGISLLQWEVFNKKTDPGYWHWKFYQNPAGEHLMMVAVDNDRIVAMFGSVPLKLKMGEKIFLFSQGVDIVVAPSYRQLGVFAMLEKSTRELCLESGVYFNYAFSIKDTYLLFSTLAQFDGVCQIFNMTKLINPTPYLKEKIRIKPLAKLIGYHCNILLKTVGKKKISIPPGLKITEVERFNDRFDHFWEEEKKNYKIALVRNSQYLNWRYIQNPSSYKIFSVEQNKFIKGFIVLKYSQEELKRGRIVDIFTEKGNNIALDLLLRSAINYFLKQNVDVVTCWMFEHWPIFHALRKHGFFKKNTPHDLIVRMLSSDFSKEYILDKHRWYLTMGDSDYY